jgi:DNA-cytosine methyltransferase
LADIGAIAAGYKPIWGIEIDPAIAEIASLNLGHQVICKSILDVDPSTLERPDILWASPVCVNFSVAKTDAQELEMDRATASQTANFIAVLRPKVFILENVRGYKRSESLQVIKNTLAELGYGVDEQVVNAAEFGVPQTRHRLILRAVLNGTPPALPPKLQKDQWIGWYEAIADLIPELPEAKLAQWQTSRLPANLVELLVEHQTQAVLVESKNANQQYGDGLRDANEPATTVITDHKPSHAPKAVLIPGGNASSFSLRSENEPSRTVGDTNRVGNLPKALLVNRNQSERGDLWREEDQASYTVCAAGSCGRTRAVLIDTMNTIRESTTREAEEPCYTIKASALRRPCTSPMALFVEAARVVRITPRALARFQTLPDSYSLPEKAQLACKIIGNGVPCRLAEAIVRQFH